MAKSSPTTKFHRNAVDPFTHRLNFTKYDIFKIAINTIWLFPLRLLLICIMVTIGTILGAIAGLGESPQKPLQGWKKFSLQRIGTIFIRIILFGFGFQWIKVTGKPALPREAPIMVVAPHSSVFDMVAMSLLSVPCGVTKTAHKYVPLFGPLFVTVLKSIFISRDKKDSRDQLYNEIIRRVNSVDEWPPTCIFAEGTTTNRKVIIRFKLGAFNPQQPVQPVVIKYKNRLNTMVWADDGVGMVASAYLTLCQFHNNLEIEFMPVYHPSEEEKKDPKLFAENVRSLMAQSCGVPTSEHTFEDVLLARQAKSLGMPYSSGIVEYGRIVKPFQVPFDRIKKLLLQFAQIDCNKDGLISAKDLSHFLKIPYDICCSALFDKLDKDNDGLITFQSYVAGLLELSKPLLNNESLLEQMFSFFDEDRDELITREDFFKLPFIKREGNKEIEDVTNQLGSHYQHESISHSNHKGKKEMKGEEKTVPLLDMTGPWNYGQFKVLIEDNLDYLLLFREFQNPGQGF